MLSETMLNHHVGPFGNPGAEHPPLKHLSNPSQLESVCAVYWSLVLSIIIMSCDGEASNAGKRCGCVKNRPCGHVPLHGERNVFKSFDTIFLSVQTLTEWICSLITFGKLEN